ncbi:hypothetical protein [Micromonospora sp. WMMD1082]|uniref:hypothetical protein n=1 Tax=Micromonospora sp. WMMD1082 TaxID=3016104 RepID=UPI002417D490|nr:hypothetical protein [Micromonospora sp. WMMD1082]MDG4796923.1 hypothetical protein [Micromonospora sp. WMMD1082]
MRTRARLLLSASLALSIVLLVPTAAVANSAEPATPTPAASKAADEEQGVDKKTVLFVTPKKKENVARFTVSNFRLLQDPPLGGCDLSDVNGSIRATYLNGVLATTESEWSAKVLCITTAPGQAMAGISVDSTWWHNGVNVANGATFTCTNCNLGNSTGADICAGVTCAGGYFAGSLVTLTLPAGWIWTGTPSNCLALSPQAITCSEVSNVANVPASN